jgi:hypothetical protein
MSGEGGAIGSKDITMIFRVLFIRREKLSKYGQERIHFDARVFVFQVGLLKCLSK